PGKHGDVMRRECGFFASIALVGSFGLAATACSSSADDCQQNGECITTGSAATSSSSSSSSSGTGGGIPGCDALPSADASVIRDECGVFVSSSQGDDANPGTKDKPLK